MNHIIIPEGYKPPLSSYDTQRAIDFIKQAFQKELSAALSLKRVSAPLFVRCRSGLNDNLSGTERPVTFDIPAIDGDAEIVHSLAKWKRMALKQYGFSLHEGILTDMNAIRRDEELDNIHSVYVDQWDWEKIIAKEDRNEEYLKGLVKGIVNAVAKVSEAVTEHFHLPTPAISREISFITTQELEDLFPTLTPEEREAAYVKEHRTTFVMKIGDKLRSGITHGKRSPDYDDWSLNGDIILWNDVLGIPFEISSMGIRVDAPTLASQLEKSGCEDRKKLPFHQMLLTNALPLTAGGGVGQSRLCMLMIGCAHIGEVQASLWDSETITRCERAGIPLL